MREGRITLQQKESHNDRIQDNSLKATSSQKVQFLCNTLLN